MERGQLRLLRLAVNSALFPELERFKDVEFAAHGYLCSHRMRIMGGYDRTDLILFEDESMISGVRGLAGKRGLFLLD
jgi:hypothetical protein